MRANIVIKFFLFTYIWSFSLWALTIFTSDSLDGPFSYGTYILGGLAPMLFGLYFSHKDGGRIRLVNLFNSAICPKKIKGKWYLVIFGLVPLATVLAIALFYILGWGTYDTGSMASLLSNPVSVLSMAMFLLLFGPFPEELGWRGLAMPQLVKGMDWARASVIVGVGWAIWHIPLLFINGTYQNGLLDISSVIVADFFLQFIALSVLTGWIWHNNGQSVLSAILFHFSTNFYGELLELPPGIMPIRTLIEFIILFIILLHNKRH